MSPHLGQKSQKIVETSGFIMEKDNAWDCGQAGLLSPMLLSNPFNGSLLM